MIGLLVCLMNLFCSTIKYIYLYYSEFNNYSTFMRIDKIEMD